MMIIAQLVLMIIAVLFVVYGMYLTCRDWKQDEEEHEFEEHVEDLMEMIKKWIILILYFW